MANNILLYNAALSGFLSGVIAGSYQTDATQADYASIVNQAVVFATAIDVAIATDTVGSPQPPGTAGISAGGGVAITGAGSSALVEAQTIKPQLLQSLCFGFAFQRYSTGLISSTYTTAVAAIKAVYFQTLLSGLYT